MKVIQKIGPFLDDIVFNLQNVTYLKIGVEHPYSTPLYCMTDIISDYDLVIKINDKNFVITEKDLLELVLQKENLNVTIYSSHIDNPYIILNIAYENKV